MLDETAVVTHWWVFSGTVQNTEDQTASHSPAVQTTGDHTTGSYKTFREDVRTVGS